MMAPAFDPVTTSGYIFGSSTHFYKLEKSLIEGCTNVLTDLLTISNDAPARWSHGTSEGANARVGQLHPNLFATTMTLY